MYYILEEAPDAFKKNQNWTLGKSNIIRIIADTSFKLKKSSPKDI